MTSENIIVYGLPNCDSTKAAMNFLKSKGFELQLHNYKTDGISEKKLRAWCKYFGWEKVLNKKSTTWRSLTAEEQEKVVYEDAAIALMLIHTSLIKRPVIEFKNDLLIGFDEKKLSSIFIV